MTCFQIISAVGTARSLYIEAIQDAKEGKFDDAKAKMKEGEEVFVEGHKVHAELVQKEANGEQINFQLLLLHAEDQLMSAEAFSIIAKEFIDLYEVISK